MNSNPSALKPLVLALFVTLMQIFVAVVLIAPEGPLAVRYDGSKPGAEHGYQFHVGPMYADVRGSVKITSTDSRVHPALRFNYLSTENDRREWIEAVRCARRILTQPAFGELSGGELSPGASVESDEEILDAIARKQRLQCTGLSLPVRRPQTRRRRSSISCRR